MTQTYGSNLCFLAMGAFAVCLPARSSAADVDLSFVPASHASSVGEMILIDIVATSSDGAGQMITTVEALLQWDPAVLQLQGIDRSNEGHPWLVSDFLADPDGINDDLQDGQVLYTALSPPPPSLASVPPDLIVTTLVFEALMETEADAEISFVPSAGAFGMTRVLGDGIQNDVTGDITSIAAVRVLCAPGLGDVNDDEVTDFDDIPGAINVFLGLDPAHVADLDFNCDGLADGRDIQPFLDLVLFNAGA